MTDGAMTTRGTLDQPTFNPNSIRDRAGPTRGRARASGARGYLTATLAMQVAWTSSANGTPASARKISDADPTVARAVACRGGAPRCRRTPIWEAVRGARSRRGGSGGCRQGSDKLHWMILTRHNEGRIVEAVPRVHIPMKIKGIMDMTTRR